MERTGDDATPFTLSGTVSIKPLPGVSRLIERVAERALGLETLDRIYRDLPPAQDAAAFIDAVLERFAIETQADVRAGARIPPSGATLVVANHPFGAIEGLVLARMLLRTRNDVRVLASHLLTRIPELAGLFIGVDNFTDGGGSPDNVGAMRQAVRWLRSGGLLLAFPAGAVSHFQLSRRRVCDPSWSRSVARLARVARATVVPVFVHGANGTAFHVAGLVHPRLRTALLPRELLNKRHRPLRLSIGLPMAPAELDPMSDDAERVRYLRMKTYVLAGAPGSAAGGPSTGRWPHAPRERIAPARRREDVRAAIAALPSSSELVRSGRLRVYCARGEDIPELLQEIGRLREITFRAVGEGTGRAADIDLYDAYYRHLFLWDDDNGSIVGAYRLCFTDEVLARFGPRGLYTYSLFRFGSVVLERLRSAIELGRSFVRAEYQRSPSALLLLWQGIGGLVAASPRHATLFGPVSISNDYSTLSRRLLVEFLSERAADGALSGHVRARRPFRSRPMAALDEFDIACVKGIEQVSRLVADLEPDGKGVPVLLRHYLRLGGRVLGFNTDERFSRALDALVVLDLRETPVRELRRYLGASGATSFLRFHGQAPEWAEAS